MTTVPDRVKRVSPLNADRQTTTDDVEIGDDDGDEEEEEMEMTEDANLKTTRDPGSPTREEVEKHYMSHMLPCVHPGESERKSTLPSERKEGG